MKLILSDRNLDLPELNHTDIQFINLSKYKIANCMGCFGCWTKTPGKCVIRDDATKIYPLIAASDQILYISKIKYGSYDIPMKTMLERAIPIQQPFIRLLHGETHHIQRQVVPKKAVILGYGSSSNVEKDIFRQLVARNANNMNFECYRIRFAEESEIDHFTRQEVSLWKGS